MLHLGIPDDVLKKKEGGGLNDKESESNDYLPAASSAFDDMPSAFYHDVSELYQRGYGYHEELYSDPQRLSDEELGGSQG